MQSFKEIIMFALSREDSWLKQIRKGQEYETIKDEKKCSEILRQNLEKAGTEPEAGSMFEILSPSSVRGEVIDNNRYQHILMTYYFGIALYNKNDYIKGEIDKELEQYSDALKKHSDSKFSYVWFLICLFHDLGYQYENEFQCALECWPDFTNLINKTKVIGEKSLLDVLTGIPEFYKPIVQPYFEYRKNEHGVYDHGITGGIKLYHDFCDIRKRKGDNNPEKVKEGYWNPLLDNVFAFAASIVTCHNIFFADKKSIEKYKMYHLFSLIKSIPPYPIKISEHPLFFLFCLVDSIEPIKIVKSSDHLEKIEYEIEGTSITCKCNMTCGCKERLYNSVRQLDGWLCHVEKIEVKGNADGGYRIELS